ncbi:uncharacterized protein KGF55_002585 [Candida pseudojiufengensis]|uniref:uncharacterized protein n=1 Tax=Candida pseudojiufengensis TaxID=497109 RepID=UPI0022259DC6|nr:uncharacterized protein KGF55_002585 [Candida pseudojiufengensis]KAI5963705.1 hypothetical protein KGF55_002585 [Candida pseudojiufengensis]
MFVTLKYKARKRRSISDDDSDSKYYSMKISNEFEGTNEEPMIDVGNEPINSNYISLKKNNKDEPISLPSSSSSHTSNSTTPTSPQNKNTHSSNITTPIKQHSNLFVSIKTTPKKLQMLTPSKIVKLQYSDKKTRDKSSKSIIADDDKMQEENLEPFSKQKSNEPKDLSTTSRTTSPHIISSKITNLDEKIDDSSRSVSSSPLKNQLQSDLEHAKSTGTPSPKINAPLEHDLNLSEQDFEYNFPEINLSDTNDTPLEDKITNTSAVIDKPNEPTKRITTEKPSSVENNDNKNELPDKEEREDSLERELNELLAEVPEFEPKETEKNEREDEEEDSHVEQVSPIPIPSPTPTPKSTPAPMPLPAESPVQTPTETEVVIEQEQHPTPKVNRKTVLESLEEISKYDEFMKAIIKGNEKEEVKEKSRNNRTLLKSQQLELDWLKNTINIANRLHDLKDTYKTIQSIKERRKRGKTKLASGGENEQNSINLDDEEEGDDVDL